MAKPTKISKPIYTDKSKKQTMSNAIPERYNFTLNYTPSDFFYLTNAADMPSSANCAMLNYAPPTDCSGSSISEACYQYQLCLNQSLVNEMYQKRDKHAAAQAKLLDFQSKYKFEVLTMVNLLVGIAAASVFIHYSRA